MNKILLLDRDGVINHDRVDFIKNPNEWQPIPQSLAAIARAHRAGWKIFVLTNQSGIGRGLFDYQNLHAIFDKMQKQLLTLGGRVDGCFYCPHTAEMQCHCRKPKTGLFDSLAQRYQCDLTQLSYIGDSLRDLQAAKTAGARPILVKTGNGEKTAENLPAELKQTPIYANLAAAVDALLDG